MDEPLVVYKTLPRWTAESLPAAFRRRHNTKAGTWAKLTILAGRLRFYALGESGEVQSTEEYSAEKPPPFIEPEAWHRVEPASADLQCELAFYCRPEHYFEKKYGLSAPHSAVVEAAKYIAGGDALDLGCGPGRNSLFLASRGFRVSALDHAETALKKLREIIATEDQIQEIEPRLYDISAASIEGNFDLILSTVVLQFLPAVVVPAVVGNMQAHTRPGGINVIVAPMSTQAAPCPIDWPFTFKAGELRDYYSGWEKHFDQEAPGTFQRLDENGDPYRALFATMIAKKPAGGKSV
ncbi:MAG: SAM-dependent methyltransferase TehB [Pseudomonadota bacterium]